MLKGGILFSSRAPIGYLAIAADELATNQGFKSMIPDEKKCAAFIYCFLRRNRQRIAAAGSDITSPEISGKTMKGIDLELPSFKPRIELSALLI